MKVLIVEDTESLQKGYVALISKCIPHVQIDWAYSLAEAKEMISDVSYDLAFLDVRLSDRGQSGLTIIPRLVATNTVTVILSAITDPAVKQKALFRGAKGYVVKDNKNSLVEACGVAVHHYAANVARKFFETYFHKHNEKIEAFTIEIIESYIFAKDTSFAVSGGMAKKYVKAIKEVVKNEVSISKKRKLLVSIDEGHSSASRKCKIEDQDSKDFANIVRNKLKARNIVLQNIAYDMLIDYNWPQGEKEALGLAAELLKKWKRFVPVGGIPKKYLRTRDKILDIKTIEIPKEIEDILLEYGWSMGTKMVKQMIMTYFFNKYGRSYTVTGENLKTNRKTVWAEITGDNNF